MHVSKEVKQSFFDRLGIIALLKDTVTGME